MQVGDDARQSVRRSVIALALAMTLNVALVAAIIWATGIREDDPAVASSVGAGGMDGAADGPTPEPILDEAVLGPLSPEHRDLLANSPADPPPPVREGMGESSVDRHYWSSDEWNLHLFRPEVEDRGGAYVGIGTDQGYMLAAWQDAEIIWVVDYDPEVVMLHRIYLEFIRASDTPKEFLELWQPEGSDKAVAIITREFGGQEKDVKRIYNRARPRVHQRMVKQERKLRLTGHRGWPFDRDMFDRIKTRVEQGRVRTMLANLNGEQALAGIAEVSKALGVQVEVLYLSNAEQYWSYRDSFRANIAALPLAPTARVLRTLSALKANGDYRYNVQAGGHFAEQVADPNVRQVYDFVDVERVTGKWHIPFSRVGFKEVEAKLAAAAEPETTLIAASDVAEPPARALQPQPQQQPQQQTQAAAPPAAIAPPAGPEPAEGADLSPCADPPPGMACIPGGAFLRGHDDSHAYAKPQATVTLSTFYADIYEVTYEDYKACESAGECEPARPRYWDFNDPKQPMTGVSWFDADQYCKAHGKSLPTEAQWEKAARGTDGRLYPWGDERATCKQAIIEDRKGRSCGIKKKGGKPNVGRPNVVGTREPNQYGLYDMAGNAWEWVADWFSMDYARCGEACEGVDPMGPCGGALECNAATKRVVRGGSWYWPARNATTVFRRAHVPDNDPFHHYGFRCVASVEQATALRSSAG